MINIEVYRGTCQSNISREENQKKNWQYGYYLYLPDLKTVEDELKNSEGDKFVQIWEEDRGSKDWEIIK